MMRLETMARILETMARIWEMATIWEMAWNAEMMMIWEPLERGMGTGLSTSSMFSLAESTERNIMKSRELMV
jgi:hypothetical protein